LAKDKTRNIILGVTASIALYKACELVRLLKDFGFDVSVVMTKEAVELIRPITFQHLSGRRVYTELFAQAEEWDSYHISLAQKASLIVIAPATANILAKLAHGLCDDLLTATVMASKAKVLIAPAMHETMWLNPITQENVKILKKIGYQFIGPAQGKLASGEVGWGRFAEPADIAKKIKQLC
jgi:phosphopantothenoylcysteine decarboxylase/phosphopantothenate--cysteine ligase